MNVAQGIGFILIAIACGCALRMWWLIQRLKKFRLSGKRTITYLFFPMQRRFYNPEGLPLLRETRRTMAIMYSSGLLGMFFIVVGA